MLYGYHKPWLYVVVETPDNRDIGLGIILELITESPYLKSLS